MLEKVVQLAFATIWVILGAFSVSNAIEHFKYEHYLIVGIEVMLFIFCVLQLVNIM